MFFGAVLGVDSDGDEVKLCKFVALREEVQTRLVKMVASIGGLLVWALTLVPIAAFVAGTAGGNGLGVDSFMG